MQCNCSTAHSWIEIRAAARRVCISRATEDAQRIAGAKVNVKTTFFAARQSSTWRQQVTRTDFLFLFYFNASEPREQRFPRHQW